MASYIQVGEDLLDALRGLGFEIIDDEPNTMEVIMRRHYKEMLWVRIYTTVEKRDDQGREVGQDAIRVVLYADNRTQYKGLGSATRVHRTTSVRSIVDRIVDRLADLEKRADRLLQNRPDWLVDPPDPDAPAPPARHAELRYAPGEVTMDAEPAGGFPSPEDAGSANTQEILQDEPLQAEEEAPAVADQAASDIPPYESTLKEWGLHLPYTLNQFQENVWKSGVIYRSESCIISAPTSAGKTAAIMMAAAKAVEDWGICVIIAPLKALTEQHAEDFRRAFPKEGVLTMTGDYQLSDRIQRELNEGKYSIVCMTTEMLGSRCTKAQSEKSQWLRTSTKTLVVDEGHLIASDGRGDKLEVALMQFAEVCPQANILVMSATLARLPDYATWIATITGKPCRVIETDFRPVKLDVRYIPYNDEGKPWEFFPRAAAAYEIIQQHPRDKFIVFCPSRSDARYMAERLCKVGIRAEFHNAARPKNELRDIERRFKDINGDITVVCATSTLAYGLNLPARRVVIMGTYRGIRTIDSMDIIQMYGRSGRLGIDPKGDAYVLVPASKFDDEVERLSNIGIRSVLEQERDLQFHLCCEIYRGRIHDRKEAREWWNRTFAYSLQAATWKGSAADALLAKCLRWLVTNGFITEDAVSRQFATTKLGQISAQMYSYCDDVLQWKERFTLLIKRDGWANDPACAMALVHPSQVAGADYVSRADKAEVDDYKQQVTPEVEEFLGSQEEDNPDELLSQVGFKDSEFKFARYIHSCMVDKPDAETSQIRGQVERWMEILKYMVVVLKWPKTTSDEFDILALRLQLGVKREHAELVRVEGVARARAAQLFELGIKNAKDIVDRPSLVVNAFGEKIAKKIIHSATDIVNGGSGKITWKPPQDGATRRWGLRPPGT